MLASPIALPCFSPQLSSSSFNEVLSEYFSFYLLNVSKSQRDIINNLLIWNSREELNKQFFKLRSHREALDFFTIIL